MRFIMIREVIIYIFVLVINNTYCLNDGNVSTLRSVCSSCTNLTSKSCEVSQSCACNELTSFTDVNRNFNVNIPPPWLYCAESTELAFTWKSMPDTVYNLEYSTRAGERNYTNFTSCGFTILRNLRPDTRVRVELRGIHFSSDGVVVFQHSQRISFWTQRRHRTPLPVERFYLESLTFVEDSYSGLIKWEQPRDKSCYYEFVWYTSSWDSIVERAITNPLHLHELTMPELKFSRNYTVAITTVTYEFDVEKESPKTWVWFLTPSCIETYQSLEKCVPDTPENFTVEEYLIDSPNAGTPIRFDVHLSWTQPKYTPDYYSAFLNNHQQNDSGVELNISGTATDAAIQNIEIVPVYEIFLVAYSKMGPSKPAAQYRQINNTYISLHLTKSWISTEFILIVVCPLIAFGIILILLLNHYLVRRVRKAKKMNYFKELMQKMPPGIGNINNEMYEKEEPDEWEIQQDKLMIKAVLGEGAFGVVRRGMYDSKNGNIDVAIKMLKDNPSQEELRQFYQEIEIMKSVPPHPHLVSLLGCITRRSSQGPLLVVEYCSKGDLQTFLRSAWDKLTNLKITNIKDPIESTKYISNKLYDMHLDNSVPTPKDLISYARQIVLGMEYLSSLKLLHRDLAARNILVCENNMIKISDFGLSRDVYHDNIYCKTTGGKLPIRWMALESMTHQLYTTQSDVWSFGILLWEIITMGSTPYPGISTQDLLPLLKNGYRMEKPPNCSNELYDLMCACWKTSPKDRPSFSDLRVSFDNLLEGVSYYLNLNIKEFSDTSSSPKKTDMNIYN